MSKGTANIKFTAQGELANISIKGRIYDFDADWFDYQVRQLISNGASNCIIYLNTIGGNVFAANEISNIIKKFPGYVDCEIGAICASAGTYIAASCRNRRIASNGQLMIHKPSGPFEGNEDEIKSDLKALSNLTKNYRKVYAKVTGMTEAQIDELWKNDYWMDAQEALEKGFVTEIIDAEEVNEEIVAELKKFGCPEKNIQSISATLDQSKKFINKMDKNLITAALGLPEDATDKQIIAALTALNTKAKTLEQDKKTLEDRVSALETEAVADRKKKVDSLIEAAIKDNKIMEADKARYEKLATADFENTSAIIASMKPYKAISESVTTGKETDGDDPYKGWKFEDYQKKAPKVLAEMKEKNPEKFNALKEEFVKSVK